MDARPTFIVKSLGRGQDPNVTWDITPKRKDLFYIPPDNSPMPTKCGKIWSVEHDAFDVHVYARATNGALITNLKDACDFIARALPVGGVACVSEERGDDHRDASSSSQSSRGGDGEPGAAFACAAYMIVAKGMGAQEAADAVETSRPGCGLRAHDEFMKNLRFLQRNGIPDWA